MKQENVESVVEGINAHNHSAEGSSMNRITLLPLLASLVLGACANPLSPALVGINVNTLSRHWVHSYEEQSINGGDIFRPDDSRQFAPSRFRMQYIFHTDGTCQWLYLDPADAHHLKDGTWSIDPNEKDVLHINQDGIIVSYRVLELSSDILRMVQIP